MSFSIGPFIGKRDAVINAVKTQVAAYTDDASRHEAENAANLIVPLVEKLPETGVTVVRAFGSCLPGYNAQVFVEVGQMGGGNIAVPQLVE